MGPNGRLDLAPFIAGQPHYLKSRLCIFKCSTDKCHMSIGPSVEANTEGTREARKALSEHVFIRHVEFYLLLCHWIDRRLNFQSPDNTCEGNEERNFSYCTPGAYSTTPSKGVASCRAMVRIGRESWSSGSTQLVTVLAIRTASPAHRFPLIHPPIGVEFGRIGVPLLVHVYRPYVAYNNSACGNSVAILDIIYLERMGYAERDGSPDS